MNMRLSIQRGARPRSMGMLGGVLGGVRSGLVGMISAAALVAVVGSIPIAATPASAAVSAASFERVDEELDQLILRGGRVIEGEILSETADEVRMKVIVAGISAPATYKKADIVEIVRADRVGHDAGSGEGDAVMASDSELPAIEPMISASETAPSVYVIHLEGQFGRDISPTPVRDAVEAARKEQPDFLIVYLNNDWSFFGGEIPDDYQVAFDWFSVADKIEPIFTKEIEFNWEKQPEVIFWVRNAMGGAAFLPFMADKIYMHPEGRIGGIGTLEQMFEGVGDEIVRQKQRSLRLARAQGLAIAGGYDYRLIDAMARRSYVLSYDPTTGELLERMPENPGEIVLTDDGEDDRADTMRQLVTGDGDDVLTLKAKEAIQIGVSSGTASDEEELLELLGILRNHRMIKNRSDRILESWSDRVDRAERQIPRLWDDYNQVQGGGTPAEQRRAIGQRISILEEMQNLYRRYGEAFNPMRGGVPNITDLELRIEQHRIDLLLIND